MAWFFEIKYYKIHRMYSAERVELIRLTATVFFFENKERFAKGGKNLFENLFKNLFENLFKNNNEKKGGGRREEVCHGR